MILPTFRFRCVFPGVTRSGRPGRRGLYVRIAANSSAETHGGECRLHTFLVLLTYPASGERLMKLLFRGHSAALLLLMSLASSVALVAQENGVIPANKILFISREYTKPGKDGTPHQMTEA